MKQLNLFLVAIFMFCNTFLQAQCATPDGFTTSVTPNNLPGTATLSWLMTPYTPTTTFQVEFKTANAAIWSIVPAITSPFQLTGLLPCTAYTVRVKAICVPGTTTGTSAYSAVKTLTTNGCPATTCAAPVITASPVSNTAVPPVYAATVTWATTAYAVGTTYTIEYKKPAATTWTTQIATQSPANIYYLDACSEYQIRVKANCSATLSSAYSNQVTITTAGCVTTCAAPVITATPAIVTPGTTIYQTNITWNTSNYGANTTYTVEYKKNTATTWTTATATYSPYIVNGLAACTEYQFRVKANCSAALSSVYSNQTAILTGGCAPPCPIATIQTAADPALATAGNVYWSFAAYAAGTTFMVEYKVPSATTWTISTTSTTASPYQITGLTACTEYQVRVTPNCSNITSNISTFKTIGCVTPTPCVAPVVTGQASQTPGAAGYQAILTWTTANYAAGTTYTIEYRKNTATTWTTATATASPYTVSGLDACSEYLFRIKANCSSTSQSTYSNTFGVQTGGCPVPCATPYVVASPDTSATKGKVTFATANYAAGTTFTIEYKLSSATTWTTATATASPYILTGLTACTEYQVRVKANCSATSSSNYATAAFKTTGCPPPPTCAKPSAQGYVNPALSAITGSVAFSGVGYSATTTFTIEYKKPSATTWTVATTTATTSPYTITSGLTVCTEYQVRVKANCSATLSSAYSNITSFTTAGCVPCPLPTGLTVSAITANSANVTWSNTGAASYTFQYKMALSTTAPWISVTTTTNIYALTGLATCKYYIVRVAPNCAPNNVINFTSTKTFKTAGCILAPYDNSTEAFVASPNPGSNVLNVSYIIENEGVVTIEIANTQGQIVSRLMNENVTSGFYQNTFNEVESLNNGVYFITLQSADGEKRVQRWVKAN